MRKFTAERGFLMRQFTAERALHSPCRSSSVQAPGTTQLRARCKRLGGFSPCHKSATTSPAAMLWSTALADAGIRSKCWRYQIQARENIPTLSRVGVEPAHHFFTCAELTAKLANYRGGMLLAGLQSWQPGLNLSAARWWAAL